MLIVAILFGILIVLTLILFILMPRAPKPPADLRTVADMERYFEKVVAASHPPGLSVAVVKNGKTIYSNGFGLADGPRDIPASRDSIYHWWSMTKIPTAIAVLQLHERGLLDIDDLLSKHLRSFNVTYKGDKEPGITIRQVLNHSAGLPNGVPDLITWLHEDVESAVNQTALVLDKFAKYNKLLFAPGEKSKYSNFGYMILGALIEEVSGQTYEQYIIENIINPIGMKNTNYIFTDSMEPDEATGSQHLIDMYTPFFPLYRLGYIVRERSGARLWSNRIYNDPTPPTGLIGPVTDVAKFMIAYLDENASLLRPETKALMKSALTEVVSPGDGEQGIGWWAQISGDGRRYLTHGGGGPGFATIFRIYPDEKLGVVVMANDSTIARQTLADVLADVGGSEMKAIVYEEFGGAQVLELKEIEVPTRWQIRGPT